MLTDTFLTWFADPANHITVQYTLSALQRLDRPQCRVDELAPAPTRALAPFLTGEPGPEGRSRVDCDLLLSTVLEDMRIEAAAEDIPQRRRELYASVRETMRACLHWNAVSNRYRAYQECVALPQAALHRWELVATEPVCFGQHASHLLCADCGLALELWPEIVLTSFGAGECTESHAETGEDPEPHEETHIEFDDF